jgi:hypothetical protein
MIRVGRNYDGNNVHPAKLSGQARTALSCIISPSLLSAAPRATITYSPIASSRHEKQGLIQTLILLANSCRGASNAYRGVRAAANDKLTHQKWIRQQYRCLDKANLLWFQSPAPFIAQDVCADVCLKNMEPMKEQIAPDIVQAITREATARGLSINDYLRQVLGLKNEESGELALSEAPPRNEEMLAIIRRGRERLKDMPVRGSTEETLKIIREARGGAMWGYDPADTDTE